MADFIAYIDEAGDEGFGKLRGAAAGGGQSRWLVIGAAIVRAVNDAKLPTWRDGLLRVIKRPDWRTLHFRNLNHPQKVVVCQEIAKRPLGVAVTMSHKVTIPGSKWEAVFKQKGYLYNYLVRWLLERLTAECRRAAGAERCTLQLVFSRRGGTDYHSMRRYLAMIRDGRELMRPVRTIKWDMLDIDAIRVEAHEKWAGLQLADCATSAFLAAVEPNTFGNYEQRYARLLRPNVLNLGGHCLNRGVSPVPNMSRSALDAEQTEFFQFFMKNGGQAPGP